MTRRKWLEQRLDVYEAQNKALSWKLQVDLIPLLHTDVFPDPKSQKGIVGKIALVQDLKKRGGYLEVEDLYGGTISPDRIKFFLRPGWHIYVNPDGIHFKTLMAIETLNVGVVQKAIIEKQLGLYQEFMAQSWVKEILAIVAVKRSQEIAFAQKPHTAEEKELREIVAERKAYAQKLREEYVRAGAVPAVILGIFAIEGPLDLLLTVVPAGKLGKAFKAGKRLIKLRSESKKSVAVLKAYTHFLGRLDDESTEFVKLAQRLTKRQRVALKGLHKSSVSPDLIKLLMRRAAQEGTVDLVWLSKMVKNKKFDLKFVERFTIYEAKPRWDILQAIVTKGRKVSRTARTAFVRKMLGLFGENAALKMLLRRGQKLIGRGYYYTGKKSIDIVTQLKSGRFVFGEVKVWSAQSWNKAYKSVINQLKEHNKGIAKFMEDVAGDVKKGVSKRLLMVEKKGFDGMDAAAKSILREEVKALGWKIELIPSTSIEDFGKFIDRLR